MANSVDPDQTQHLLRLIRVYTVCSSFLSENLVDRLIITVFRLLLFNLSEMILFYQMYVNILINTFDAAAISVHLIRTGVINLYMTCFDPPSLSNIFT